MWAEPAGRASPNVCCSAWGILNCQTSGDSTLDHDKHWSSVWQFLSKLPPTLLVDFFGVPYLGLPFCGAAFPACAFHPSPRALNLCSLPSPATGQVNTCSIRVHILVFKTTYYWKLNTSEKAVFKSTISLLCLHVHLSGVRVVPV